MQISRVSLTLTWPHRLCLFRVLLGASATATSFPLSKHTEGGDTAPAFSGRCVYLQLTWEVGLLSSPVEFSSHCHFYKLSHNWLLLRSATPAFSGQLVYLQFREGFPSPPLWCSGCPTLLAMCLFYFVIAYYLVFLFSLGGGQSVQGAMLIWPRVVCGSTTCHLAHLVVCFSQAG
jgi:hypothetical protein